MTISVVIPTYNRSGYLTKTLESVLAQTRPADEILVVDDGSTDDTREVVDAIARSAAPARPAVPLRYHYQANAHLGAARNTGQRFAAGEALLFLDSDDLLRPEALHELERALVVAPEAALAYTRSQTVDEKGDVTEPLWDYVTYEGDVWCDLIPGNFIRSAGSALVRRSHLEQAGPWKVKRELGGNEDWDMWLRLAERAPFVRVDEPLFQYRVHGTGLSANEPINYHWAMVVLEMHRQRNLDNPVRLAALARAYDRFHEGTRHRWRLAARQDWRNRRWRSAFSRQWYLLRLDLAHRRTSRALAPFRAGAQPVTP